MGNTDFTESVVTVSERRIGPMWLGVPEGVKHIRDIEFQKLPTRSLLLDIFMPEDPPAPVPVILWICGGGWRGMNKDGVEQVAAWICGKGFAVVGLQYRVSSEARFPAQIQDCKAALRWVRAEGGKYRLDGARVGVWGDSAGGHLAALLGVSAGMSELEEEATTGQSTAVSAVCAFYPPMDLRLMAEQGFVQDLIGGPLDEQHRRMYELASPITHVNAHSPPHLLVHGDADELVPYEQSPLFMQAMHRAGVSCRLLRLPGVGHSGRHLYSNAEVRRHVAEFFVRYLRP